MDQQPKGDLEEPDRIESRQGERRDGRPTGDAMKASDPDVGDDKAPTLAPEETGGAPSTEHAPGADL